MVYFQFGGSMYLIHKRIARTNLYAIWTNPPGNSCPWERYKERTYMAACSRYLKSLCVLYISVAFHLLTSLKMPIFGKQCALSLISLLCSNFARCIIPQKFFIVPKMKKNLSRKTTFLHLKKTALQNFLYFVIVSLCCK
jgi:hypothetical protein